MTDASSSEAADDAPAAPGEPAGDGGPVRSGDGADDDAPVGSGETADDDRPERPPSANLVDALGIADHAKRGLVVGVVLAVGVFGFFVLVPLLDPSTPARSESPLLYLALALVVATSATLLVASALAVRSVTGRVMAYEKWVRRAAITGGLGGAWLALTGTLATALAIGAAPASIEPAVLAMLPLPPLVVAAGTWAALARTGANPHYTDGNGDSDDGHTPDDGLPPDGDHVRARPRRARTGTTLALGGIAILHVATFTDTTSLLAQTAPSLVSATVIGTLAVAAGTAALASTLAHQTNTTHLPTTHLSTAATALAGAAAGLTLGSALTATPLLTPLGALLAPGLAWTTIAITITQTPGTYPERPI